MRFGINTLDDFTVSNKTVLCRIDINQPVDRATGTLKSTTRIKASIPTIKELSCKGAKVVLLAHQGSDIEYKNFYTLAPHADIISELLGKKIKFVDDICGPVALEAISSLQPGEVLLLNNVRFCSEEQTIFEKSLKLTHEQQTHTRLVEKLAPLADLYMCDAFAAAHRDQPSLCAFEYLMPSCMGRLFEREYSVISGLMECPERPCIFVLGGAKIADAFEMMETVLKKGIADHILTGGLVGNIMLISQGYDIGNGSIDFIEHSGYSRFFEASKKLINEYGDKIMLPRDIAYIDGDSRKEAGIDTVPQEICALDIGSKTASEYMNIIMNSKTVFVNGPMGVFENPLTESGTSMVWEALGDTGAFTVIGGGDSITATAKYGKTDRISYICTGGGALIRFLSGEELPVIKALRNSAIKFGNKIKP